MTHTHLNYGFPWGLAHRKHHSENMSKKLGKCLPIPKCSMDTYIVALFFQMWVVSLRVSGGSQPKNHNLSWMLIPAIFGLNMLVVPFLCKMPFFELFSMKLWNYEIGWNRYPQRLNSHYFPRFCRLHPQLHTANGRRTVWVKVIFKLCQMLAFKTSCSTIFPPQNLMAIAISGYCSSLLRRSLAITATMCCPKSFANLVQITIA